MTLTVSNILKLAVSAMVSIAAFELTFGMLNGEYDDHGKTDRS